MVSDLGVGIVGLASYYSRYYAGRAGERPDCSVAAAARVHATDEQLAESGTPTADEFADEYGGRVYESVEALLDDDAVDVVVACSPTTRRADHAVRALESGRPVLTGKPAAATPEGADRIAGAAREAGLPAVTTAPQRLDTPERELARRVADGAVGDIHRIRASVYHGPPGETGIEINDGHAPGEVGTAYTMGFYTADSLCWLADARPERVTGALANLNTPYQEHPDVGSATVEFADGAIGTMTITMSTDHGPGHGWDIEVVGSDGTLRTHHGRHGGLEWSGDDGRTRTEAFGRSYDPVLDRQFDAFVEAVRDGAGPDAVPPGPEAAADGIALCSAWERAAERGERVAYER